jgi:hypothetical protein
MPSNTAVADRGSVAQQVVVPGPIEVVGADTPYQQ